MRRRTLRIRGCHPYRPAFQLVLLTLAARLVPVRSPLLGEYLLISFPPGNEMFQFPGFALSFLCIQIESTCLKLLIDPAVPRLEDKSSSSEAVGQTKT
jgi:hypothetical protein